MSAPPSREEVLEVLEGARDYLTHLFAERHGESRSMEAKTVEEASAMLRGAGYVVGELVALLRVAANLPASETEAFMERALQAIALDIADQLAKP